MKVVFPILQENNDFRTNNDTRDWERDGEMGFHCQVHFKEPKLCRHTGGVDVVAIAEERSRLITLCLYLLSNVEQINLKLEL